MQYIRVCYLQGNQSHRKVIIMLCLISVQLLEIKKFELSRQLDNSLAQSHQRHVVHRIVLMPTIVALIDRLAQDCHPSNNDTRLT